MNPLLMQAEYYIGKHKDKVHPVNPLLMQAAYYAGKRMEEREKEEQISKCCKKCVHYNGERKCDMDHYVHSVYGHCYDQKEED